MCYRVETMGISLEQVSRELNAEIINKNYCIEAEVNAFARPALPMVLDCNGRKIAQGTWGIERDIPKNKPANGLNLMAEKSQTFYKNIAQNRCLIPVSGFYEWTHYPAVEKKMIPVKHRIQWENENQFYIAGLYEIWEHGEIGFGLLTTKANELMSTIHNTKMRMPICLTSKMASSFLTNCPIDPFSYPAFNPTLVAENIEPGKIHPTLFG